MTDQPAQERQQPQATEEANPADVRLAAMNLLARREHSVQELRQKLLRRFGLSDAVRLCIEEQLQRLTSEKLQSDQRYVESFVRQRSSRGYGPLRIEQEARSKGLQSDEVFAALEAANVDWCELAQDVLRKKFGDAPAEDIKDKARRVRFLQYRGFGSEHYAGHF